MTHSRILAPLVLVLALVVAACGGGGGGTASPTPAATLGGLGGLGSGGPQATGPATEETEPPTAEETEPPAEETSVPGDETEPPGGGGGGSGGETSAKATATIRSGDAAGTYANDAAPGVCLPAGGSVVFATGADSAFYGSTNQNWSLVTFIIAVDTANATNGGAQVGLWHAPTQTLKEFQVATGPIAGTLFNEAQGSGSFKADIQGSPGARSGKLSFAGKAEDGTEYTLDVDCPIIPGF